MAIVQRITQGMLLISPFVFPLYFLRFKIGPIPFTVLEVFIYGLFGLYVLAWLLGQAKIEFKAIKWAYFFCVLLILGASLGAALAPNDMILPGGEQINPQMISLGILKGWVIAPLLYFFVLTQQIRERIDLKKLLLGFVASGALVALGSYFFAIFGNGFTVDGRLAGFFESANYLSLYLVPAFLLSFGFFFQGVELSKKERWLNLISLTIIGHALVFTQSYAAILGVFGAIGLSILYWIIKHRKKSKKVFWAFVSLMLVFVGLILSQLNSPKFQQFLDWENRSSTSVRLEIYYVSAHLIGQHPLVGIGPDLFQSYYQTQGPLILERVPLEWNMPHPHNVFLAFWLNAGILGFLAFLGFIVLAHRKFTYPLLAFWGILIHGLFDMPFWKNDLAMVFWLILGSIFIIQSLKAYEDYKA